MTIRQGRSRTSSLALSSASNHTSLSELVECEVLEEVEVPKAEVYDEPIAPAEPSIKDRSPPPEEYDHFAAVDIPISKKSKKKAKKGSYSEPAFEF